MRIYVCGAHSTGKTTIARYLSKELRLPLVNEVARQVLAEMEIDFSVLRVRLDLVSKFQRAIFERQMEVEESFPEGFVSDRSFDNLAYAARHTDILPDLLDHPSFNAYVEKVRNSLVLFVRPSRECLKNDGVREDAIWEEVVRIDGIVDFLFAWKRIPCVGIAEHSMKSRIRTAMTAVQLYKDSEEHRDRRNHRREIASANSTHHPLG